MFHSFLFLLYYVFVMDDNPYDLLQLGISYVLHEIPCIYIEFPIDTVQTSF